MDEELIKNLLEVLRQYLKGGYIKQAIEMVDHLQEIVGKPDVP